MVSSIVEIVPDFLSLLSRTLNHCWMKIEALKKIHAKSFRTFSWSAAVLFLGQFMRNLKPDGLQVINPKGRFPFQFQWFLATGSIADIMS